MQPGHSLVLTQKGSRGWDVGVTAAVTFIAVSRLTSPAAARNSPMGGVNHYSLHCRLAKFPGLRRRGKFSAVIG
jgi:hypothetical protein